MKNIESLFSKDTFDILFESEEKRQKRLEERKPYELLAEKWLKENHPGVEKIKYVARNGMNMGWSASAISKDTKEEVRIYDITIPMMNELLSGKNPTKVKNKWIEQVKK